MIANTPSPPYYAVIFCSIRTDIDDGYALMSTRMIELAKKQDGFLGVEFARQEIGITVSYWKSLEDIKRWKQNAEHTFAREKGRSHWYKCFKTRIAKVEKDYSFSRE